jgi:hypothetical protein
MKTLNIITLVLLTATMILAAGCGKDPVSPGSAAESNSNPDPGPQQIVDSRLVGMWMFTGATVDGSNASLAQVLDWESATATAACQIDADGGYLYAEFDSNVDIVVYYEASISTDGNRFKIDHGTSDFSGTWSVTGTKLALRAIIDGSTVVLMAENLGSARSISSMVR